MLDTYERITIIRLTGIGTLEVGECLSQQAYVIGTGSRPGEARAGCGERPKAKLFQDARSAKGSRIENDETARLLQVMKLLLPL